MVVVLSLFLIDGNLYSLRVFYTILNCDLSLESEWEQVSSGLQDSSEYSSRFLLCCGLDYIYSSSDFQFLQFPFQALWGPFQAFQLISLHVPQFSGKV